MMHGYMAFNKEEEILVPFRTWRNTNTGPQPLLYLNYSYITFL